MNSVTYEILATLLKSEEPLSVYSFKKDHTIHQYRYWCKKLESELIITPITNGRRKKYKLNQYFEEKIRNLLSIQEENLNDTVLNLAPGLKSNEKFFRLCSALKSEKGWAFADATALLLWVPILDLELARFTVCVRDRNIYRKLIENFPSNILEVELLPSPFIRTDGIKKFNGFPIMKPEILFTRLLKKTNERLRLSALFLMPYLDQRWLFKKLKKNYQDLLPTVVYGLFALQNYLKKKKRLDYLDQWFYNLSQYDWEKLFTNYIIHKGRKGETDFTQTKLNKLEIKRIKLLIKTKQWDFWDQCAMLFPERKMTFRPEAFENVLSIRAMS